MQCVIDVMPASVEYIKSVVISLWLHSSANQLSVPFAETSSGQCPAHCGCIWLSHSVPLNNNNIFMRCTMSTLEAG